MSDAGPLTLDALLRRTAGAEPFYPGELAAPGAPGRAELDEALDRLRLAGLVELTEWAAGKGQGYRATDAGRAALSRRRFTLRVVPRGDAGPRHETRTTYSRGEAVRSALLDRGVTPLTQVMIGVNVLVFVLGLVLADGARQRNDYLAVGAPALAHRLGALTPADLAGGELWRLLTCCFVHHGLMHLVCNVVSLGVVGPMAERLLGGGRFLALYLIAGAAGSLVGVAGMHERGVLAGASGAVWGLTAGAAACVWLARSSVPPQYIVAWGRWLGGVLVINLAVSLTPRVSSAAHFGGGLAGAVAAALLFVERFSRDRRHTSAARAATVALAVAVVVAALVLPKFF